MKINNIVDNNYKYKIIDEMEFNNKYLSYSNDNRKYKKYLLVCYKEKDILKYDEIPDESYLDRFTNIIKIYKVEEIISSCDNFDSMYDEVKYFHADDLYFIKFLIDEESYKIFNLTDDYKKIEDYFIAQ